MYFEVTAKVQIEEGKKPKAEKYLVEDDNPNSANNKVIEMLTNDGLDYEITQTKKTSIRKVIE